MEHEYYSPNEAAQFLGLAPITLSCWRSRGTGPAFSKLDEAQTGRVIYRRGDLELWQAQSEKATRRKRKCRPTQSIKAIATGGAS